MLYFGLELSSIVLRGGLLYVASCANRARLCGIVTIFIDFLDIFTQQSWPFWVNTRPRVLAYAPPLTTITKVPLTEPLHLGRVVFDCVS